jgi:hypothetical protein
MWHLQRYQDDGHDSARHNRQPPAIWRPTARLRTPRTLGDVTLELPPSDFEQPRSVAVED